MSAATPAEAPGAPGGLAHGDHLDDDVRADLWARAPRTFDAASPRSVLAASLGAVLYVPANRPTLADDLVARRREGALAVVVDLEDGVPDGSGAGLAEHVGRVLRVVARVEPVDRPVIFVRPRSAAGLADVLRAAGRAAHVLAGVVAPKYRPGPSSSAWWSTAEAESRARGRPFWVVPVLEHTDLAYRERRVRHLTAVRADLAAHACALSARVGGTDLSGYFGLRRDRDTTIYDLRVVADVIADVVNVLGRGPRPWFVSGPVWEYFGPRERLLRTPLRTTPFTDHDLEGLRADLVRSDLDGLLREAALDRANGLWGKTVIHPSHVAVVHAVQPVSHAEYRDARDVLRGTADGARRSAFGDKMNEGRPHRAWARQIVRRAGAFGVLRPGRSFVDLLAAAAP